MGLTQQAFASVYHILPATLKGWEQTGRQPDATACAYLSVIAGMPEVAHDVLRGPSLGLATLNAPLRLSRPTKDIAGPRPSLVL
jgi:hypothetical protein